MVPYKMLVQDQQQVVDKFCARHGMQDMAYHIPSQGWEERGSFFRHILYDDTTELIFAYLPKVMMTITCTMCTCI